jgi:hypothetical protein
LIESAPIGIQQGQGMGFCHPFILSENQSPGEVFLPGGRPARLSRLAGGAKTQGALCQIIHYNVNNIHN